MRRLAILVLLSGCAPTYHVQCTGWQFTCGDWTPRTDEVLAVCQHPSCGFRNEDHTPANNAGCSDTTSISGQRYIDCTNHTVHLGGEIR